jgi:asparagine synthase (glutamine-hydrolysing)
MIVGNGLAAFWCKDKNELEGLVAKTLSLMKHRAWNGYFIYDGKDSYKISKVSKIKIHSNLACISCLNGQLATDLPFIHGFIENPESLRLISFDKPNSLNIISGEFSLVHAKDDELTFSRDHLGTRPLFFTSTSSMLSIASERRVLCELGFKNVTEVNNACMYKFKEGKLLKEERWYEVNERVDEKFNFEKSAENLAKLIERAISVRVKGKKKVAVCFSGGLDSSIIAHIASKYTKVTLITVALKGSRDEEWAKLVADNLRLEHILHIPSINEIKQALIEVRPLLRKPSVMDLTIATTLRLIAKIANDIGCKILLVGQAADELFGGYEKFLRVKSVELSKKRILKDIKELYFTTFSRDEPAIAPFVIPLFPYTCKSIVDLALSLPIEAKINYQTKERKIILRKAAKLFGLADFIVNVPKKALQYSTGMEKVIAELTNVS